MILSSIYLKITKRKDKRIIRTMIEKVISSSLIFLSLFSFIFIIEKLFTLNTDISIKSIKSHKENSEKINNKNQLLIKNL
jgi:cellulose synthase/poly-beta-1,6-N-acetylglucosamine synthase-like glycosyltransferase